MYLHVLLFWHLLYLLLLSSSDPSAKATPAAPKLPNFCTQTQSSARRYLLHFDCHFSTGRGSASQPAWRKGSCWCTPLPKCGTDSGSSATWWLAGGGVKLAIEPEGPVSANSKPKQPQPFSNPNLKGMFLEKSLYWGFILGKQHPPDCSVMKQQINRWSKFVWKHSCSLLCYFLC